MPAAQDLPTAHLVEVAWLERQLAQDALKNGRQEQAWNHLYQVLVRLSSQPLELDGATLFSASCLDFSNLCFRLGRGFSEAITFLETARATAETFGDRRSGALVNLHLGRLYYFGERRTTALEVFAQGKAMAEELGDDDILTEAAEFIGLFFFVQGLFQEAERHFELAASSFEGEKYGRVVNPSGPMWLSYCTAYLGQFHRAIGTLDYYRRLALERGDKTLAATYRSVLGLILLIVGRNRDASFHLSGALQEAIKSHNALAKYFAKGGLAYHHLLEGRWPEALEWLSQAVDEAAAAGLIRQYASPFAIEMLYELHRHKKHPLPQMNYPRELSRIMQESNVHLQGVAWRLRAMEAAADGQAPEVIESYLRRSEECLKRSGDPVQLGKTWLEMARLNLRLGRLEPARSLAQQAFKGFSGYGDAFYPDDLRNLLTVKSPVAPDRDTRDEFLQMFMDMIQGLVPSTDLNRLLNQTVAATNRFFGAERGGLFWFNRRRNPKGYELRAACNLSLGDVAAEEFRPSLSLVFQAKRENSPQVFKHNGTGRWPNQIKSVLCVPFELGGLVQGVLYHDNSYVNNCFESFGKPLLAQMANSLATYIDNLMSFTRRMEERTPPAIDYLGQVDSPEIVSQSPAMGRILRQADRIAGTDSTILILGETGVGKELLAHRLHQRSLRSPNPFVIVDPTTLPENLVESELFGHEKGAFTGADRLKLGRLELSHQGTLFIDEVGEIPKSIQVKLLRALQEKAIFRVGGNQAIKTDFRLIAATNRDLAAEVVAGRFREDLYYRLNVVPLIIPPLRERREDILLLVQYFLNRYATKYNRPSIALTPENEAKLLEYDWPGNVRELKNVIERAVLLSSAEHLDLNLPRKSKLSHHDLMTDGPTLDEMQRRYIRHVIELAGGKIGGPGGAAEILGMKRTSLINRMKKLGLT